MGDNRISMDPLIGLRAFHGPYVTVKEYEEIKRAVEDRHLTGATTPGDRHLAQMLVDNLDRYRELKHREEVACRTLTR